MKKETTEEWGLGRKNKAWEAPKVETVEKEETEEELKARWEAEVTAAKKDRANGLCLRGGTYCYGDCQ